MASIPTGLMISESAISFPATDPTSARHARLRRTGASVRRFLWAAYPARHGIPWKLYGPLPNHAGWSDADRPMPRNERLLLLGFGSLSP